MKASDISDEDVIAAVRKYETGIGAMAINVYPELHQNWKIARAKVDKMIRRGILTGCTCGCRGDFKVANKETK